MKKIMPLLLTALMTVSTALPGVRAAENAQQKYPSVKVSVDWSKVTSNATNFSYGLNGFIAFNPASVNDEKYQAGLKYMNPGIIRYHSWEMMGESTNNNGWIKLDAQNNPSWDVDKIKAALEGMATVPVEKMIDIPGPNGDWHWNESDGRLKSDKVDAYVKLCADLVKIVNVDLKMNVKYWEPQNEWDDKYYVQFKNNNKPDDLDTLIDIYNKSVKAMKTVDSTILTGGAAFARADLMDQVSRFISGTVNEGTLDWMSYHFYASGDMSQSDDSIYNRLYNAPDPTVNSLYKHTLDIRNELDKQSPNKHIPLWLDEYNISWSWTNNDPRMHNNKGGVFDALALIYANKAGADVTNAWNECDGVYGKLDGSKNLQPNAHVFQLFNNYLVGDGVQTQSADENKIVAYAVKNPTTGVKSYVIVNRSNNVQIVDTAFNAAPAAGTVKQHQVSEAGYSITDTTWAAIEGRGLCVPASSVTVLTESTVNPTILPQPIKTLTQDETPSDKVATYVKQSQMGTGFNEFDYTGSWGHGGVDSWTNTPGDSFTVKFWGSQIKLYTKIDSWNGIMLVSIDNGTAEQVDTYGTNSSANNLVYTSPVLAQGEHTLKVTVADTKNAAAHDYYVCPNGVEIISDGSPIPGYTKLTINDSETGENVNKISYSENWGYYDKENGAYRNDNHYSNAKDAFCTVTFYGSQIKWLTKVGPDMGKAALSVDGGQEVIVDNYAAQSSYQALRFTSSILPVGFHTLNIRVTGEKNDAASDYYVTSDVYEVTSNNTSVPVYRAPYTITNIKQTSIGPGLNQFNFVGVDGSDWGHGGTDSWIDKPGASFSVKFQGKRIRLYTKKDTCNGIIAVSVDNGEERLVDTYGNWSQNNLVYTSPMLTNGEHTLNVRVTDTRNPSSGGYWICPNSVDIITDADLEAPAAPSNLALIAQSENTAAFSWEPATDNMAVVNYEVYYGSKLVASIDPTTNTYFVQGLVTDTPYEFTVKAKDASGNVSAASEVLSIAADRTAPVITLKGNAEVTVPNKGSYTDAGVTITDNADTNLKAVVTYTKDGQSVAGIDTAAAGIYTIHYNVTDAAGNAAIEATRTVIIGEVLPKTGSMVDTTSLVTIGITLLAVGLAFVGFNRKRKTN